MAVTIVGVRFKRASKVYYFDPAGLADLKPGDEVIVETSRGREIARVVIGPRSVDENVIAGELKPIDRLATPLDRLQSVRQQRREAQALRRCREMVAARGLPMKVIAAEYSYDGSRLTFSFTAEKRVDFRELVRDLAKSFHARIELRQVGVRDEAKILGGLGTCGHELCCRTWMTEFSPVSIKMAKHQGLPLSPMEISGQCGRLLCCLAFEDEHYVKVRAGLPKVGQTVETGMGPGRIHAVNALKESVTVELESGAVIEVPADELRAKAQAPAEQAESAATAAAEPVDEDAAIEEDLD
ncbi:MAG: stage 0 sporulation family protein [Anaerolineae bacterium]|nr:stage 0 sporulation family protein [Anaerolineae bacterium]